MRYLTFIFFLLLVNHQTFAQTAERLSIQKIENKIKQADIPMDQLSLSPYADLYQISYQNKTAYIDSTGQYLFVGQVVHTEKNKQLNPLRNVEKIMPLGTSYLSYAKSNITHQLVIFDQQQSFVLMGQVIRLTDQMNINKQLQLEINKQDWEQLPLHQAIKQVKGNGQRKMAVFADPYCFYCQRLEKTLQTLDNVTIYTFLYPLKPNAKQLSQNIWCTKNVAQAWQDYMLKNREPQKADPSCLSPIQKNIQLGQKIGLYGTPSILFENGYFFTGELSKAELEHFLMQSQ